MAADERLRPFVSPRRREGTASTAARISLTPDQVLGDEIPFTTRERKEPSGLGQVQQGACIEPDPAHLLRDRGPDVGEEILTHQRA
ncbi:hypothetical protein GCM10009115_22840 [Sphingopyxis soli]|uniref:Uncharacterized protein n=1 Tax=Sphingopyxis soli TaxID=592051 RepID=A0ABN1M7C6_9SPHN